MMLWRTRQGKGGDLCHPPTLFLRGVAMTPCGAPPARVRQASTPLPIRNVGNRAVDGEAQHPAGPPPTPARKTAKPSICTKELRKIDVILTPYGYVCISISIDNLISSMLYYADFGGHILLRYHCGLKTEHRLPSAHGKCRLAYCRATAGGSK